MTETPGPASAAAQPPARRGGPQLPWGTEPAKRADKLILGLLIFSGVYGLASLFLVGPWVGSHPLRLAAVKGSASAVVTLGASARAGHTSLWVALFAGLPATIMFDWIFWWAGRRWGENALHMVLQNRRNADKRIARVKRFSHRYGWLAVVTGYIFPIPVALIAVAVGMSGMSLPVYMVLDAVGALIWLGLLAGLGFAIGNPARRVADQISHYSIEVTIALVVFIVLRQAWQVHRQAGASTGGTGPGPV